MSYPKLIQNIKNEYKLQCIEKRHKLETEWDSSFFMNSILCITDFDIDSWRIHIKLNSFRYVSLYFVSYEPDNLSCIFNSLDCRLNFRLYHDSTILQYFSADGKGFGKTKDEFLISDLEDKETAFALSTIYEDIPLMVRYLDLYKNLDILRKAIHEDIKDINPVELRDNKDIIKLENYRCLLSI